MHLNDKVELAKNFKPFGYLSGNSFRVIVRQTF